MDVTLNVLCNSGGNPIRLEHQIKVSSLKLGEIENENNMFLRLIYMLEIKEPKVYKQKCGKIINFTRSYDNIYVECLCIFC